ncbi:HlyD family efflux transporter periplasmic adaptor subunit [Hymenobacter sp. BT635]|uniref:HlyD family efflux transporter periplasmic adaptor subunit n=1 Tax=Hymenobacter nitidus TaxID=2880929 RepID=A0ABS8AC86_9BACT|nr:HlyD family efflux transporter periplasmic adaptor subunit [Hymenobacter nitidus]MCB2377774.1 HlyD family efflux transporter periplasmic adaptor subunit [Hymenobacter nitidus]
MKFLVALLLLAATIVSFAASIGPRPRPQQLRSTPPALAIAPVAPKPNPQAVSRLVGFTTTTITASAPSTLVELYFYEGQYVRRGQVLAKLRVRSSNAVAYLNAPHDGVLARAQAPVGEVLTPQVPLTVLTDQTRLLVRLHPASLSLHPGDSVQVAIAHANGASVRGKITEWHEAGATPTITLHVRKSVAGAVVGAPLLVAATPAGPRLPLAETAKGRPGLKRRQLHSSLSIAQE